MTDGGPLGETARSRIFGAALNAAWPDTSIGAPHTLLGSDLYVLAEGMPQSVVQYQLGGSAQRHIELTSYQPLPHPCWSFCWSRWSAI